MPVLTVFYIKLLINLGLTFAIVWTVSRTALFAKWQIENEKMIFLLGFVLLRLIPWIGIFLVLNEDPRGDIPFFFYKAEAAKKGGFVYRDFWSYHAPLYAYIISLPVWIWHNSRAIVLFMVLMESGILWLTYKTYKFRTERALQLAIIYYLLPAGFMYILVDGQEEVWFWGAALLMWRFTIRKPENYEVGIGLLYALALLTIKVTFIFLLPALLLVAKKPVKMLLVMAAVGLPAIGFLYWQIGDLFLMPIQHTEQLMTPNLFSISRPFIEMIIPINEKKSTLINWFGLLFTVFIPAYMAYKARYRHINEVLPGIFIACFVCMMIFQASAMGAYVIAYLMAVLFEIVDLRKTAHVAVLLLLNWLTVVQPFIWVYIKQPAYTSLAMFANAAYLFEYVLQILNVLCFFWVLRETYRKTVRPENLVTA
ncbi:hypothetical protein [Dyadobacter sediminis]|uniref:DUF2029 domain-containing protein n=1 Tax=Dyadobacter sediminis TaxID=1493691 RepID=A0A5R9K676_9BACT|nr:hypothetical protein [Dyadobacter sediminis]TLU89166.1 hypothetical protein FEM55_24085 [Dyadobacter sediminis]GGC02248.1 hypothetical protein GCM10011325_31640 [Dyadobacter sediminis]